MRHTVYSIFDADGAPLYVGVTGNFPRRMEAHYLQDWAQSIGRIDLRYFEDRSEAEREETRLVLHLRPSQNKAKTIPDAPDAPFSDLLAEVRAFCCENGMTATAFGTVAMSDPRFVTDLAAGRECRRSTVERVRRFISTPQPAEPEVAQ